MLVHGIAMCLVDDSLHIIVDARSMAREIAGITSLSHVATSYLSQACDHVEGILTESSTLNVARDLLST